MNTRDKPKRPKTLLWTAVAGSVGGIAGNIIATPFLEPFFNFSLTSQDTIFQKWLGQSLMFMFCGTCMGLSILAANNRLSLRGRWNRDLGRGLVQFASLAFVACGVCLPLAGLLGSFFGVALV